MSAVSRFQLFLLSVLLWWLPLTVFCQVPAAPKHEFRGAWINTIHQTRYAAMSKAEMQAYFNQLLDTLQQAGFNVVLFQVRPQSDAWYKSSYEPWSSFITGRSGRNPGWDPLAFMVEACHERRMDIHAWINPYRVRMTVKDEDFKDPFVRKHRQMMVRYGRSLWLDPGLPESRNHILKVVKEIVANYDIDGIHLDDYFYPYPVTGEQFPDGASFAKYAASQGFTSDQKADWRRDNVNRLVFSLHELIREEKPWVRFGISPFGIHRNQKQDPDGSRTNGLSNYDDLYADALKWMKEGWIDYCVPQLYWEIGHERADYATLVDWWGAHRYRSALYIGQDVDRTMKASQLEAKLRLERDNGNYQGNCYFPVYELEADNGHILSQLKQRWHRYPALMPADKIGLDKTPEPVFALDVRQDYVLGAHLTWNRVKTSDQANIASYYVIYRYYKGEDENLDDPAHIVGVSRDPLFVLPSHPYKGEWVYLVTSVNRLHRESAPERIVVRVK